MWQAYFLMRWEQVSAVLNWFLGGLVAILLGLAVLAVCLLAMVAALSMLFDRITGAMAKRWEKTGRRPAARWAEIIARGNRREE